jgi:hypothetical protein
MAFAVIRYRQVRAALAELRLLALLPDVSEHDERMARWAEQGQRALAALRTAEAAQWLETWIPEPAEFVRSAQLELDTALARVAA